MSFPIRQPRRNFDNDTCCETYCPCCPRCNCSCNCDCCNCNCTKKKMIVPTFILSAVAFILILIEMMTKVSDTNTYIEFRQKENKNTAYPQHVYEFEDILDIESSEDNFTLALICIGIFIFFLYLILLICFIYEHQCFANYNPKCKQPYYMLIMIINFIAVFANAMICFIFFSYRVNSIDKYKSYNIFSSEFGEKNDLNMSLSIISAFTYLVCLIFHLITCYYLFIEDGICSGCCSEFINCISCCKSCLKCFFCCCCCGCCEERRVQVNIPNPFTRRGGSFAPQNILPVVQFNVARPRNTMVNPNIVPQETSQLRNYINDQVRMNNETTCKNDYYGQNYAQFTICNLCKNNFSQGQEITILPCGHIYHKNCIYNWFARNKTCPDDGTTVIN